MPLVYERKVNYVPTELQTNLRSHARLVTSAEKSFPQCMFGRLVLNLLKSDTFPLLLSRIFLICENSKLFNGTMLSQGFLGCFRDPIRVPRIENRYLDPEKIIIGSLESEKIGSLENEKSGT